MGVVEQAHVATVGFGPELQLAGAVVATQDLLLLERTSANELFSYQRLQDSWAPPLKIATTPDDLPPALMPTYAAATFSDSGPIVVFADRLSSDGNVHIYAARNVGGAGWSSPQQLSTGHRMDGPVMAKLPDNRVLVVWIEGTNRVLARELSSSKEWGAEVELKGESDTRVEVAVYPQLVADERGSARVFWYMDRFAAKTGRRDELMARAYEAGAWGPVESLAQLKQFGHWSVASSKNGRVVVSWREEQAADQNTPEPLWARTLVQGSWNTPIAISNELKFAYTPQSSAIDDAGNVVTMWLQAANDENKGPEVWANQLAAGSTWSDPVYLGNANASYKAPDVTFDAEGRATAIWFGHEKPNGKAKLVARTLE